MKEKVKRLPFNVYHHTVLILAIAGLVDSIYLSYSHYLNYTDVGYNSFCAISRAINCDTVSQSPYSIFLNVPVPIWGALGYLALIFIISASKCNKQNKTDLWNLIFLVSIGYSLISIVLALVSTFLVRSYCIMCILSYSINFMIGFVSWIVLRRFDVRPFFLRTQGDIRFIKENLRFFTSGGIGLLIVTMVIWFAIPQYWKLSLSQDLSGLNTGVTEAGSPWIGAEKPAMTITEFTDYMCFQCKKMHFHLRKLVAKYPDRIRLVHRHFPMDNEYNPLVAEPYHSGSGKMAMIAIYAQAKEHFWEVNDFLFDIATEKKDFNTRIIAKFMGVNKREVVAALGNKHLRLWLKHDIAVGLDLGITGTPTYVIDGNLYLGNIPSEILEKVAANKEK